MAIRNGTELGETINGTEEDDVINGLGGTDTLNGLGGNDILDGGEGSDTLNGGDGDDELRALSGSDIAQGGAGNDTLIGDFSTATVSVFTEERPTINPTLGGFAGSYLESGIRRISFNTIERVDITTGSGNDSIFTTSGDDVVRTGAGDDMVYVGSGIDTADGGADVDGLSADFSADPAGVGIDLRNAVSSGAFGSFSNFEYFIDVTGSAFDDVLIGSDVARNQTIRLGDGDDVGGVGRGGGTIVGGLGTDTAIIDFSAATAAIINEEGPIADPTLGGFNGSFLQSGVNRAAYSSVEQFVITTGSGNDGFRTADGDDIIRTNGGSDTVDAGEGVDIVDGGAGNDILNGGGGPFDTVSYESAVSGVTVDLRLTTAQDTGGAGTDTISNFERVTGSAFGDTLTGTDAANWLVGGAGADTLTGLGGSDLYFVDDIGDVVIEQANGGTLDEVTTTLATYTLGANLEVLTGRSGGAQTLIGNELDNAEIRGSGGGGHTIFGLAGNDRLVGGGGNDFLDGGTGADRLVGNSGSDIFIVDNVGDVVTELELPGTDEIRTALANYLLPANVENLTGLGDVAQSLTGNALDNVINGGNGNDTLSGQIGADTLIGGMGDDRYLVRFGGVFDTVVEAAGGGTDEVVVFTGGSVTYELAANVENLTFAPGDAGIGTGTDTGIGNALANVITGGDGVEVLDGRGGADTLRGGGGNDTLIGAEDGSVDTLSGGGGDDLYQVGDPDDVITETANGGVDEVRTALATYALAVNVENLTYTGAAAATLTGNASNNVITGGDGDDLIVLGIAGGAAAVQGDDKAFGGAGHDGFYFASCLTAADEIDGGVGTLDQVGLQGNYAGLTLGARNLVGVEFLVLLPGDDTRFGDTAGSSYSYNITTVDANVAAGQRLAVSFNRLRLGENVTFNGAAETDGSFIFYGGNGTDTLTGGQQDDGFFFGTGRRFGSGDVVNGQGGTLDQLGLQGDYAGANKIAIRTDQIVGVEMIVLLSGGDTRFGGNGAGYNYDLTWDDTSRTYFSAANSKFFISANTLRSDETLTFDGRGNLDFSSRGFDIFGGAGADTITGSFFSDVIQGGAGDDRIRGFGGADRLIGGEGADTFVYESSGETESRQFASLVGFDHRVDRIDVANDAGPLSDYLQGALRRDSFDQDLALAVNAELDANGAVFFTANGGDQEYVGRSFLIIDGNGDGLYSRSSDYVIEFVAPIVPIPTGADFLI